MTWYGDEFLAIVERNGDEALFAAGQIVLAEAERRAPSKSGKLRKSGYISTQNRSTYVRRAYWRKEKKPPKNTVTVGFAAPHAHLIESGRRTTGAIAPRKRRALAVNGNFRSRSRYGKSAARPFLGPAIDATRETMVQELAAVLRKRLEAGMPGGR
ncbi:MAG: HK97 gp10 family phage protein [Rhizobiales bacterium]|nr:HK97 gp10 family phage protein [Hyphomicrobiales bacterium]